MIGKNKNTTVVQEQIKIGSVIGPGAVFDGNFKAPETVRIDGTLNGDCICEGNLILGTDGEIKGNIVGRSITLSGKVTGDIRAQEKLELFSTARVKGDITARSLVIDEDAHFDGRCTMTANQAELRAAEAQKVRNNSDKEDVEPQKVRSNVEKETAVPQRMRSNVEKGGTL